MNPISALIASTGLCSARAFLPAFIAALMLRFGGDYETVRDAAGGLIGAGHVATWFTSNTCLIVLGVLAALEFVAQRSHDARAVLAEIDHWAKPVMGAITAFGLLSAEDVATVDQINTQHAGMTTPIFALLAAGGTYAVARARNEVQSLLHDADSDNATGIHGIIAWAEDAYAVFGMLLFILLPVLVSILIGLSIGVVFLLQRRAHAREEATRVPCTACSTLMYRSAVRCPSCKATNASVCRINWLGVATSEPADAARQPVALLCKRRCPACASRLAGRTPRQTCTACGTPAFADSGAVSSYDAAIQSRLLPTLGLCAVLGVVPVLGLIAGVLYYRINLVSPYRAYIPLARSMLMRWALRLLFFVLIVFQIIPGVGAVTVPLMALLNYLVYRKAFLALAG
ncbi:MAG: DUF4126 family protein [Planctomycetota bacterium]